MEFYKSEQIEMGFGNDRVITIVTIWDDYNDISRRTLQIMSIESDEEVTRLNERAYDKVHKITQVFEIIEKENDDFYLEKIRPDMEPKLVPFLELKMRTSQE
jgi:hypothetical protein